MSSRIPSLTALFLASCLPLAAAETITIDGDKTYQSIEGFGTCLIGWGSYPK